MRQAEKALVLKFLAAAEVPPVDHRVSQLKLLNVDDWRIRSRHDIWKYLAMTSCAEQCVRPVSPCR